MFGLVSNGVFEEKLAKPVSLFYIEVVFWCF